MKDQGHPSALVNYATVLLCQYGSAVAGSNLMILNIIFSYMLLLVLFSVVSVVALDVFIYFHAFGNMYLVTYKATTIIVITYS